MANTKNVELVNPSDPEKKVSLNDPMPPTEPGHKGESLDGGAEIFDPNAALRYKEGRDPWLQDSERINPAHWPAQLAGPDAARVLVEREASKLEKKAKALRDSLKGDEAASLVVHVGEGDLRGETKDSRQSK